MYSYSQQLPNHILLWISPSNFTHGNSTLNEHLPFKEILHQLNFTLQCNGNLSIWNFQKKPGSIGVNMLQEPAFH